MRNRTLSSSHILLWSLVLGLALCLTVTAQTSPSQPSPDTHSQSTPGGTSAQPSGQPAAPGNAAPQAGANPQSQSNSGQSGTRSVEDELQLTPDQKEKIATIVDDENRQIAGVRTDNSLSLEQKQQKVMQIRQDGSPKIKAILTPEQLQKLAAIQQQKAREQQQSTSPNASPQPTAPQAPPR